MEVRLYKDIGFAVFLARPFPRTKLLSITHKDHILQTRGHCQTSVDLFRKVLQYPIVLSGCSPNPVFNFLLAKFYFIFQDSAHLLLTAGFSLCSEKYLNLPWASSHAILKFLWAEILLTSFSSTSWLGLPVFWSTSTPFKKEYEAWDSPAQKPYVPSNTRPIYVTVSLKSWPQIYQLQMIRKIWAEIIGHFLLMKRWKDIHSSYQLGSFWDQHTTGVWYVFFQESLQ